MIWFTSDLHFGHENIIKICSRPYADINDMDEVLIENWNSRVSGGDRVYIIGDLIYEKAKEPEKYLSRLKGKKILITGNHDKRMLREINAGRYFEEITPYLETRVYNRNITFCHYPMLEWQSGRKEGTNKLGYHIHGHIHNNRKKDYEPLFRNPFCYNAGADINGFAPVTFDELDENNEKFKLDNLPDKYSQALFIARKYHGRQHDKSGAPYIGHPIYVASQLAGEEEKLVALLHDVLEDTEIKADVLKSYFPESVTDAIAVLTHSKTEDYFSYIKRVKQNPLAAVVKAEDLKHNMNMSRLKTVTEKDMERYKKYSQALRILCEEI